MRPFSRFISFCNHHDIKVCEHSIDQSQRHSAREDNNEPHVSRAYLSDLLRSNPDVFSHEGDMQNMLLLYPGRF